MSVPNPAHSPGDRLDSWKEIAAYLKRGVRTVQRWERLESLPVHRLGSDRTSSVFAYKAELDAWWREQSRRLDREADLPELEPETTPPPPPKARVMTVSRLSWVLPTIILAAVVAVLLLSRSRTPSPPRYRPLPVTSDRGNESQPSFSPDGKQIVYIASPENSFNPDIFVRTIGADTYTQLTSTPELELSPVWSPDGRSIAFLRASPSSRRFAVLLMPATGGQESLITELAGGRSLSWSRDGEWLVSTDGPPLHPHIVAISVATGAKHPLTPPTELGHSNPVLSPDLRRLAYAARGRGYPKLMEVTLGPGLKPTGSLRQLTPSSISVTTGVYHPNGKEIIYSAGAWEEGLGLYRLNLQPGSQPEAIVQGSERYLTPAISADGRRLAFGLIRVHRIDIWRKSLIGPPSEAQPLISSTHSDLNPSYSPDGRQIAFHSTRSGDSDIWIADANGAHVRRLTYTNALTTATPRWSPDGQWIAFESSLNHRYEVYVVRSAGGPIRRLTGDAATNAIPSWSRDGKFVYFTSDRTGRYEIWKVPFQGGDPVQITRNGGFYAVESADAKYLYYNDRRELGQLWRIPLAGGASERLPPKVRDLFYAVSSNGVYFATNSREIAFWSSTTGAVTPVLSARLPINIGIALSPDEKSLLFTQTEQGSSDIYYIDNFR